MKHSVSVGNVGVVLRNASFVEAQEVFREYRNQSKAGTGSAGFEEVTWFKEDDSGQSFEVMRYDPEEHRLMLVRFPIELKKQDLPKGVEKAWLTYVIDRQSQTYACELTPAYYGLFVRIGLEFQKDATIDEMEEACEWSEIEAPPNDEGQYFHVDMIKALGCDDIAYIPPNKKWDTSEENYMEDVVEYLRTNPVW